MVEVDRRAIGTGKIGDVTARSCRTLFFDVVRGHDKRYATWCTPVYT